MENFPLIVCIIVFAVYAALGFSDNFKAHAKENAPYEYMKITEYINYEKAINKLPTKEERTVNKVVEIIENISNDLLSGKNAERSLRKYAEMNNISVTGYRDVTWLSKNELDLNFNDGSKLSVAVRGWKERESSGYKVSFSGISKETCGYVKNKIIKNENMILYCLAGDGDSIDVGIYNYSLLRGEVSDAKKEYESIRKLIGHQYDEFYKENHKNSDGENGIYFSTNQSVDFEDFKRSYDGDVRYVIDKSGAVNVGRVTFDDCKMYKYYQPSDIRMKILSNDGECSNMSFIKFEKSVAASSP
ncbi:hypothetical protein ACPRNU_22455 [Chromobacterium vaccinii]|uniref:hypothetical protein n=1 Tax=Chromobacterium vaccinii TaxID=1108595 RepID=UPI003C744F56